MIRFRMTVQMTVLSLWKKFWLFKDQIQQHTDGRNCLRKNSCPRGSVNAHMKTGNKKDIQYDVQHRRYRQKDQRSYGISDASYHRGTEVIKRRKTDAKENNAKVQPGIFQGFCRNLHPYQKRIQKQNNRNIQNYCDNCNKNKRIKNTAFQIICFAASVKDGADHTAAHTQPQYDGG